MRNILLGLIALVAFTASANAEVFTKEKREINYTLTAKKPVDFQLDFSSVIDKAYIPCEVRVNATNENNKVIMRGVFNMKKGSANLHMPVKIGKYNLKLFTRINGSCLNKKFDLKLTRVSGNFEQEDNDLITSALQMKELSYYYGYMQRRHIPSGEIKDDKDFYKIVLPKNGLLTIVFSHKNYEKKYQNVRIKLLDVNGKVLDYYDSYLNTEGERKKFQLKKGTYFIELINETSSGYETQHMPYKIAYTFSAK